MARNSIAKKVTDSDAGTVTFQFSNGRALVVCPFNWPESIQREALLHGASQKLGDEYAGAETADQAEEWVRDLAIRLADGDWNQRRGEGRGEPTSSAVIEALARRMDAKAAGVPDTVDGRVNVEGIMGVSPMSESIARAKASWDSRTKEQRDAIRKNPLVKALVSAIRASRDAAAPAAEDASLLDV